MVPQVAVEMKTCTSGQEVPNQWMWVAIMEDFLDKVAFGQRTEEV